MDPDSVLPALVRDLPAAGTQVSVRRLQAPGCGVLMIVAPAGTDVPRHAHDTANATLVVSGATTIITDEGEQHRGPGEWYETRPGQLHAVRFDVDTVQLELRFERPRP